MRNLSMKKFGTPIGAGPGSATEKRRVAERRRAVGLAQRRRRACALSAASLAFFSASSLAFLAASTGA